MAAWEERTEGEGKEADEDKGRQGVRRREEERSNMEEVEMESAEAAEPLSRYDGTELECEF